MALVSHSTFVEKFPGLFDGISPALINKELASAELKVNEAWTDNRVDGILYLAAHHIVMGNRTRCCKNIANADTYFLSEYTRIRDGILVGDRVV